MTHTLLGKQFGFEVEARGVTPPLFQQVHGTQIVKLPAALPLTEADGGYTFGREPIFVFTADCYPALLFSASPAEPVVALHAGWRGIRDGIVARGLELFQNPGAVHVVIGPGIGRCCFEVKADFLDSFVARGLEPLPFVETREKKRYFDLTAFLRQTDLRNLPEAQIHLDWHACTYCQPEWPSYRRNGQADPRIRSWIQSA